MPKRRKEDIERDLQRYYRKIRKLEEKQRSRCPTTPSECDSFVETQDDEIIEVRGGTPQSPEAAAETNTVELPHHHGDTVTCNEVGPNTTEVAETTEQHMPCNVDKEAEVLDPEVLLILGDPIVEKQKFGPDISDNLASRWTPILRKGLNKVKQSCTKFQQTVNCS
ncbi:unnamed protein product [Parnassius mnemosyne]|uniref:Uncharacterized protein n=1 Tax=Parnassius mnemosyne TaxID=213953 RepID=A0AAV1LJ41_9NEOP